MSLWKNDCFINSLKIGKDDPNFLTNGKKNKKRLNEKTLVVRDLTCSYKERKKDRRKKKENTETFSDSKIRQILY